jgi:Uma2 family endonuclease
MATERYPALPPYPDEYDRPRRVGEHEYLRLDQELPGRHEYHDGLMYPRFYPPGSHWAMAGGTVAHDDLIVRMVTALSLHLGTRGPCKVHTSDLKLRAAGNSYYPDVYVACGETRSRQTTLEDATFICEVRSQSTAEFDRGDKFVSYQRLPGLHEYLIVDNRRPRATLYRKTEDGEWLVTAFSAGASIPLTGLGLDLPVEQIYEGVTLDPDPASGVE